MGAASNLFTVRAALTNTSNSPTQNTGAFCQSENNPDAYGAVVTVVCATGAVVASNTLVNQVPWKPSNGDTYQFIKHFNLLLIDSGVVNSASILAQTSWRTVYLEDQGYIELLVAW